MNTLARGAHTFFEAAEAFGLMTEGEEWHTQCLNEANDFAMPCILQYWFAKILNCMVLDPKDMWNGHYLGVSPKKISRNILNYLFYP